jgi:arylsulfatase A-like enzyme
MLKKAGYATGITGKWGLGESRSSGIPNKQGFDEWYGYLNQNHAVFYYTDYLWRNDQKDFIPENRNNQQKAYTHDLMTDFALDFIQRHQDNPFFLFIPYTIPHFNIEVPELEEYTENKDWPRSAKIYASMITRMDRDVGKIIHLINQLGIDRNTLVFFTSDNGPDYSKGAENGDVLFNSNGPFKGAKGSINEGGIRVPMIVHWPGKVPAGKVSDAAWYFADIPPTLAALTGETGPLEMDGINILPVLTGSVQLDLSRRFMYWEQPARKYSNLRQAARYGKWKVLRPGPEWPLELYDLENDPGEAINVASRYQNVVSLFETFLKTARTDSPFWPME